MKKLAAILAALAAASALAMPAMAADSGKNLGEVPRTSEKIAIDGKKDTVYDQGMSFTIDMIGTETSKASVVTGKATILWDGTKTIYAFVEVKDSTMTAWSEANYKAKPWENDSVELFFNFSNDGKKRDQYRIDTNGSASYYGSSSIITELEKYGFDGYAYTKTADGYCVEFQVSSYNTEVAIGSKIGIDWQINDMQDATTRATIHYKSSQQAKGSVGKFDYIVLGSKTVSAPAQTTAATQKAPAATGSSAATFDAAVILAAAAAIAGAGVVVSKKKR